MTIEEILTSHPKGMEYAHLLEGMEKVPIIEDSKGAVLSFPPIINGDHTTVQSSTRDLFIDVTGWDRRACESSLMLIALQAKERGGDCTNYPYNRLQRSRRNPSPMETSPSQSSCSTRFYCFGP